MHTHQSSLHTYEYRAYGTTHRLLSITAVLTFSLLLTFPRSFLFLKLTALAAYLILSATLIASTPKAFTFKPHILLFYLPVSIIGTAWSILGLVNGAPLEAIIDALRLYVIWSFAYIVLIHLLIFSGDLLVLHRSIVAATFAIAATNISGTIDSFFQLNLISEYFRDALNLRVGFHSGYIQITSHNIGMLFFITPYLLFNFIFQRDSQLNNATTTFALVAALLTCVISGRRALWLALTIQPLLFFCISLASGLRPQKSRTFKVLSIFFATAIVLATALTLNTPRSPSTLNETLTHIQNAFSNEDERSLQAPYLLDSFLRSPVLGNGFGTYAGYARNEEKPWLYELTYHQLAMNLGLMGLLALFLTVGLYLHLAIRNIRSKNNHSTLMSGLLIGVISFFIAAYSNPYFGSFDFLLIVAIIPLLAYPRKSHDRPNSQRNIGDNCQL